ncbi:glycosyltransferase family 4 protein [Mesorhizobium sp.]|uniref:glycosyltransferase family 4 protein n=1 Tax=Mesorhizobium sp. TaxID=1871066 RepID=UPI0025BBC579|nr:glycosyltransferase family 4 protein [Mesorhizobium sp.]
MRFGMAISNLSSFGGLQRDCLSIARHVAAAGHDVTILTTEIRGAIDPGCQVRIVKTTNPTNPGRDVALGAALAAQRRDFDRIVGFNKLPMLDIYYSGDRSYAKVKQGAWRTFSPRFRTQMQLEQGCFAPGARTSLIMLSERQQGEYQSIWKTPDGRFRRISPNLDPARRMPHLRSDGTRERMRAELGIGAGAETWLSIGWAAWVKGFDRVARALEAFPDCVWLVAGIAAGTPMAGHVLRGVPRQLRGNIRFLGFRDDIPAIMAAADLLVHPARIETTGTVIVEALANGLPVILTETCGFAHLVEKADAGLVIPGACSRRDLIAAISRGKAPGRLQSWSSNARIFGADPALSRGHEEAARLVAGELW